MHQEFVETISSVKNNAKTPTEAELADLLLRMYALVSWHEPVIQLVNQEALKAMEQHGTD